ncbi:putative Zn-dependent peptidase [Breznakia sp. PF5-3]|uniref:EF-P 5-aminopentanol modification-associated protein YfmH n=1 Tax=unclassified Breznakia TaxID=2623764 RepID=UPI0024075347|nr:MULTISPECIES: pitrilysin family protein [unclassified Breznakia]MDF9823932.1 putative Zn-dependent peptidase [Breznakia sp. PM6-1]MDF9834731.1 putative Zn-dependent peptidase [Breznakia sp. PF5-3]MDF9836834.1 putative Zn-dependent peptidase [Breznakia sp. PFB2-8]MDF9858851.1 putative Zn-dependent peptidase [Breznakia sp. PH5-24]
MNKIENKRFEESYIEETLENGLHVVIWQKPGFKKSNFVFATPFGGRDSEQLDENNVIHTYPHGVAHFLEHKMFEKEGKDVMEEFSSLGANVNAFTSYNETAYYFSTTNNPIKPLHLLLDFVQELTITEASVEKEKGIIIQELEMYKQMSDSRLFSESFESIFQKHPLRNDIGGTAESVTAITYDILQECYKLNYHPSKMILVGVSAMDPTIILDEIKKNQAQKDFPRLHDAKRVYYDEPKAVGKTIQSIAMDISTTKVADVYKFDGIKNGFEASKIEWCLTLLLDLAFSPLSKQYQVWLDDEIINDAFSYEVEIGPDYGILLFSNETKKTDSFFEMIQTTMLHLDAFDENELSNLKKRYFGTNINSLNSFEAISISFMRMYFSNIDFFKNLEMIETITKEDLYKAYQLIDQKNHSKILIEPKKAV